MSMGTVLFAAMEALSAADKKDRQVAMTKLGDTIGFGIDDSGTHPTNGEWIVFSNGLQVCWNKDTRTTDSAVSNRWGATAGQMFYDSNNPITFPATFAAAPTVLLTPTRNAIGAMAHAANPSTTGCAVIVEYYFNANAVSFAWWAIGWAG